MWTKNNISLRTAAMINKNEIFLLLLCKINVLDVFYTVDFSQTGRLNLINNLKIQEFYNFLFADRCTCVYAENGLTIANARDVKMRSIDMRDDCHSTGHRDR